MEIDAPLVDGIGALILLILPAKCLAKAEFSF